MGNVKAGNLEGTLQEEFYIGKGDIDTPGQNIIGLRTDGSGNAEYKEAGGSWKPFSSFDVDSILVDDVTGEVLTDDVLGNVLVRE
jgi:hypothetical protein